jgi:arginine deiminase
MRRRMLHAFVLLAATSVAPRVTIADVPVARPGVFSEHGTVRRVLVARPPRRALLRVTRASAHALLFEHPVDDAGAAVAEHDEFTDGLRAQGIHVDEVTSRLAELMEHPAWRAEQIDHALRARPGLAPRQRSALHGYLDSLTALDLADALTGGVSRDDVLAKSHLPLWHGTPALLVDGHANLYFTRDTSKAIGTHVAITDMATPLRQRETALIAALFEHHPAFADVHRLEDPLHAGFNRIEGGDLLVLDHDTLLIGMGERTTPAAVAALARELFARGAARRVIATALPPVPSMFHLDTILNRVGEDAFVAHPVVRQMHAYVLTPRGDRGGVHISQSPRPLMDTVAEATGRDRAFQLVMPDDVSLATSEQALDGANVFPFGGGVFVYSHNAGYNAALEHAGIATVPFAGTNLVRGRGGPHCMTRPLECSKALATAL